MKDFKPLDLILCTIGDLKKATKRQIIKHHKITSPSQKDSIQQSLYNARHGGLIIGKREPGNPETFYSLTQLGKDKQKEKNTNSIKKLNWYRLQTLPKLSQQQLHHQQLYCQRLIHVRITLAPPLTTMAS